MWILHQRHLCHQSQGDMVIEAAGRSRSRLLDLSIRSCVPRNGVMMALPKMGIDERRFVACWHLEKDS